MRTILLLCALAFPVSALAAEPAIPKRCEFLEGSEENTEHPVGALLVTAPNCLEPISAKLLRHVEPARLVDDELRLSEVGLPLSAQELGGRSGITFIVRVVPADQYHGVGPLPDNSELTLKETNPLELRDGLTAKAQIGDIPAAEMARDYVRLFEIREGSRVHVFDFRFTINCYNAE